MDTIGSPSQAQAPPQHQEEWIKLMRSEGGDLGALDSDGFNGGSATWATTVLNSDDMMHPLDLAAGSVFHGATPILAHLLGLSLLCREVEALSNACMVI